MSREQYTDPAQEMAPPDDDTFTSSCELARRIGATRYTRRRSVGVMTVEHIAEFPQSHHGLSRDELHAYGLFGAYVLALVFAAVLWWLW